MWGNDRINRKFHTTTKNEMVADLFVNLGCSLDEILPDGHVKDSVYSQLEQALVTAHKACVGDAFYAAAPLPVEDDTPEEISENHAVMDWVDKT